MAGAVTDRGELKEGLILITLFVLDWEYCVYSYLYFIYLHRYTDNYHSKNHFGIKKYQVLSNLDFAW